MTISRVQYAEAAWPDVTHSSLSASFASPPTRGNLLIAFCSVSHNGFTLSGSDWTSFEEFVGTGLSSKLSRLYYKVAGASEPSLYTMTTVAGAARMTLHIVEYAGIDSDDPLDVYSTQQNWAGSYPGYMGAPRYANGLVVHAFSMTDMGSATVTAPAVYHVDTPTQVGSDQHSFATSRAADSSDLSSAVWQTIMTASYVPDTTFNADISNTASFALVFRRDGARDELDLVQPGGTAVRQDHTSTWSDASRSNFGVINASASFGVGDRPTAGSLLIGVVAQHMQSAYTVGVTDPKLPTTPAGWTHIGTVNESQYSDQGIRLNWYTKVATGSETSVTWSWNQTLPYEDTYGMCIVVEYLTASGSTLDVSPTSHDHYDVYNGFFMPNKPRSMGPPAVTTTAKDEIILMAAYNGADGGSSYVLNGLGDSWTLLEATGAGSITASERLSLFAYLSGDSGALSAELRSAGWATNSSGEYPFMSVASWAYVPDPAAQDAEPTSLIYQPRRIYPAELPFAVDSRMMEGIDFDA